MDWKNAGLPESISNRSDTPIQQQVLKDLNTEMKAHNISNPKDKKTIRYVKVRAQLVSLALTLLYLRNMSQRWLFKQWIAISWISHSQEWFCTKKQFKAVLILLEYFSVEMCRVRISFEHGNFIVVAAYIPPVSAAFTNGDLLAKSDPSAPSLKTFNSHTRKIRWLLQEISIWKLNFSKVKLRNLLAPMYMKQLYPFHPTKGCSLDLLFSTLVVESYEMVYLLFRCDEHHIQAVFIRVIQRKMGFFITAYLLPPVTDFKTVP